MQSFDLILMDEPFRFRCGYTPTALSTCNLISRENGPIGHTRSAKTLQLCDDIFVLQKQTDRNRVVLSQKFQPLFIHRNNRNFGSYANSYSLFCRRNLNVFAILTVKNRAALSILVALWQGAILVWDLPHYLLPTSDVFQQLASRHQLLWQHTMVTLLEIFLGLFLGFIFGLFSAILLSISIGLLLFIAVTTDLSSYSCFCDRATAGVVARLWIGFKGRNDNSNLSIFRLPPPVMTAEMRRRFGWNWHKPCKLLVGVLFKVRLPAACLRCIRFTHSRFHCTDWRSHRRMGRCKIKV